MDPKDLIAHRPGFLSPEHCRNIIHMKEKLNLVPGQVYDERRPDHTSQNRICNLAFITPDSFPYTDRIRELVNQYNNKKDNYILNDRLDLQFVEYNEGAWFKRHQDTFLDISNRAMGEETRKISLTIQLSDTNDYTGGDVVITTSKTEEGSNGTIISREQGSVTIFPSYFNHEVNKITSGVRYALVAWQWGPYWR
tara:strand:- start:95 stop:679 length:585 start_codon:yes stop_codon:yes gene_type:complete